ncbi:MAG: Delta-1-pyrroline-5-carboxylate dehydrogenase [uncultured Thermomicrobiales bacterium]|uniref:L-glutamate gamma-semialdehyde dehydrogenase n=1 Tax=uncultured Thermomicrobiales bacterium TaxID=1645740 RepID=A0A6J4USI6_9BACT|nr:MAG: Delta-1-pyrroline-5-carboxylate dehydrogenase [uncultured Thermomicrobiales bacterium]
MTATVDKITYTSTPEQIRAMHAAFDEALAAVEADLGKSHPMVIDGQERTAAATFEVRAPADRDKLLGVFQSGTRTDVDDAVAAAKAAFPSWAGLPYAERVAIFRRAAELIRERKFRIASLLVHECGKNRVEAIGEVEEAADMIDEYTAQVEANNGFVRELGALDPGERNRSVLRPFGVWAVLAPFNFPFALSVGMSSGALLAGNTVVIKPASATPLSGYELCRIYHDAGMPAGVFNFVTGAGAEVGEPLALHPDVDGLIFTGSKEVGFDLYKRVGPNFPKPVITELGGKNPTIVTAKADLAKAVEGVARSAFGFSGQKCSACSRVYVERPVYDEFVERLTARTKELTVGDPTDPDTYVGPVIDDRAVERYERAIASAEGGTVRTGGTRLSGGAFDKGTFVAPTVIDGLPADHELFRKELFLPVLVAAPVDDLDQALEFANDTEYGLTAGIFSEDQGEIERFFDRIEAGVVYANRKGGATTGAWPGCQSFAGWKASGSSGKGGLGPYYVQQFLREQSRTVVVDAAAEDVEAEQAAGE